MSQLRFDWEVPGKPITPARLEVELDPKTTKTVLALMAQAMLAVARAVEELGHDR